MLVCSSQKEVFFAFVESNCFLSLPPSLCVCYCVIMQELFYVDELETTGVTVPFKGYKSGQKRPVLRAVTMKRTRSDHGISSEDLSSKRIVRRKVTGAHRQSHSPAQDLEPQRREVRTTASVLKYAKYSGGGGGEKYASNKYHSKYSEDNTENKFDHYEHRTKSRDVDDIGRNSIPRRVSSRDHGASNHHGGPNMRFPSFHERFDYSLRIGNLDVDMMDGDLKTYLFDLFKHFGYIHIKVLGRGCERHAFINFTQKEDAQRARDEMAEFLIQNVPLKTEWSKSTLNRYPEVANSTFGSRPRRGGLSIRSSHGRHLDDHYDSYGSGRDNIPVPSREKSYSSREVTSRSSREVSRNIPRDMSRDIPRDAPREPPRHIPRDMGRAIPRDIPSNVQRDVPRDISYKIGPLSSPSLSHGHHSLPPASSSRHEPRAVVPITDPTATRTLFVGNLEPDITERELRDLFGPYGRIESVDIKTQRLSGATYAFVKFLTINDAINAKSDMHGRKYGEYRLKIGFGRGSPTGKVWIGNLTCFADLKEVRQELDRFGLIRKLDYAEGDNHAFIQFDSLDAAQAAIASLVGYRIRNSGRTLKIDMCKPMYLREDPDSHLRHGQDRSHSMDDSFSSSFKRKVRDHDYDGSSENIRSRTRSSLDIIPLKGERIISTSVSSKGRGREGREDGHREYRKRPHSPGKDSYSSSGNKNQSEGFNGVNEYHTKRPRIVSEDSRRDRERVSERDRDRDRSRDHERDSKRSSGDKERTEPSKKGENVEENGEPVANKDAKDSVEKKEERPVLEPTLSDIAAAKDTALKLDDVPEQLAMDARGGGSAPLEPKVPETLADLAILYPVAWRGNLVLKNTGFPTRMHLVGGDPAVAEALLRTREGRDYLISLRITQRLRLEQPRLEEVNKRMASAGPSGYCVLLALPGPTPAYLSPETDSMMQLRPLKSLVSYLKQKEAAGIVALSGPDGSDTASASVDKDAVGVLHAFPPCDFSQSQLVRIAPRLGDEPSKEDHIVVLLVKGNV